VPEQTRVDSPAAALKRCGKPSFWNTSSRTSGGSALAVAALVHASLLRWSGICPVVRWGFEAGSLLEAVFLRRLSVMMTWLRCQALAHLHVGQVRFLRNNSGQHPFEHESLLQAKLRFGTLHTTVAEVLQERRPHATSIPWADH
jgi:hypothetical protein